MNKKVFSISGTCLTLLLLVMFVAPAQVYGFIQDAYIFITNYLGIFYLLTGFLVLIFTVFILHKHGKVVLGAKEDCKTYSEFAWGAMMFCTGIGGSMMIFSFIEPLYYLKDTPFGIEEFSQEAYEYAHMYGQFHWGVLDWMLCVPVTLFIAYSLYVNRGNFGSFGNMLAKKEGRNLTADIIDVFCILAIIGGAASSMGLAAPIICQITSSISGIPNNRGLLIAVFAIWFLIFTTSVWKGLEKGIKKLSYVNVCIAILFILLIFLIANPLTVIKTEMNSIGLLGQNFIRMTLYTAPFEANGFPQRWTVFYWALTLAYLPGVAIFTARISKGRTIRQLVYGMVGYGSLGTMFSFATLGCYSLYLQRNGIVDLANILQSQGKEAAIIALLETLPLHQVFCIVFALTCMIFMATTIDSSVYVIASIISRKMVRDEDPPRWLRVMWAVLMLLFSMLLTLVGGLETMQTASIITAFPIIFINTI